MLSPYHIFILSHEANSILINNFSILLMKKYIFLVSYPFACYWLCYLIMTKIVHKQYDLKSETIRTA